MRLQKACLLAAALAAVGCDAFIGKKHKEHARRARLKETARRQQKGAPVIWVHAFARSGSSTILTMVSLEKRSTFSVFEPCDKNDRLDESLAKRGCPAVLTDIKNCDFRGIKSLHNWKNSHTWKKVEGRVVEEYSPEAASSACKAADKVTLKTVKKAFNSGVITADDIRFLNSDKRIKMLDVIRDPRSIFSSWLSTFPFNDTKLGGIGRNTKAMIDVCDDMAKNIELKHPRLHRIVFDEMVKDPRKVLEDTYKFIGLEVGDKQKNWVMNTFNAKDCPGVDMWIAPYSDCHTDSRKSLEKWRTLLTDAEKKIFSSHPQCRKVAETYGFSHS